MKRWPAPYAANPRWSRSRSGGRGWYGRRARFLPKFAAIRRTGRPLYGPDPLAGVPRFPEQERFAAEQALRNVRLRLVYHFIKRGGDPPAYTRFVLDFVPVLYSACNVALELEGTAVPRDRDEQAALYASVFGVDTGVLVELARLKLAPRPLEAAQVLRFTDGSSRLSWPRSTGQRAAGRCEQSGRAAPRELEPQRSADPLGRRRCAVRSARLGRARPSRAGGPLVLHVGVGGPAGLHTATASLVARQLRVVGLRRGRARGGRLLALSMGRPARNAPVGLPGDDDGARLRQLLPALQSVRTREGRRRIRMVVVE